MAGILQHNSALLYMHPVCSKNKYHLKKWLLKSFHQSCSPCLPRLLHSLMLHPCRTLVAGRPMAKVSLIQPARISRLFHSKDADQRYSPRESSSSCRAKANDTPHILHSTIVCKYVSMHSNPPQRIPHRNLPRTAPYLLLAEAVAFWLFECCIGDAACWLDYRSPLNDSRF